MPRPDPREVSTQPPRISIPLVYPKVNVPRVKNVWDFLDDDDFDIFMFDWPPAGYEWPPAFDWPPPFDAQPDDGTESLWLVFAIAFMQLSYVVNRARGIGAPWYELVGYELALGTDYPNRSIASLREQVALIEGGGGGEPGGGDEVSLVVDEVTDASLSTPTSATSEVFAAITPPDYGSAVRVSVYNEFSVFSANTFDIVLSARRGDLFASARIAVAVAHIGFDDSIPLVIPAFSMSHSVYGNGDLLADVQLDTLTFTSADPLFTSDAEINSSGVFSMRDFRLSIAADGKARLYYGYKQLYYEPDVRVPEVLVATFDAAESPPTDYVGAGYASVSLTVTDEGLYPPDVYPAQAAMDALAVRVNGSWAVDTGAWSRDDAYRLEFRESPVEFTDDDAGGSGGGGTLGLVLPPFEFDALTTPEVVRALDWLAYAESVVYPALSG